MLIGLPALVLSAGQIIRVKSDWHCQQTHSVKKVAVNVLMVDTIGGGPYQQSGNA